MPPKRKGSTSPPSPRTPPTPTTAELVAQRRQLLAIDFVPEIDASPTPLSRKQARVTKAPDESTVEVLPSTTEALDNGAAKERSMKQGMTELPLKKAVVLKRKATTGDNAELLPALPKCKKAAPKKRTTKTPKIAVESGSDAEDTNLDQPRPRPPLSEVLKYKIRAVNAFLDAHPTPALLREDGTNIATIDELDLLAALTILRVDYQLESSAGEVSLAGPEEMVVAWHGAGMVSVDFDRSCEVEREVHLKLAARAMGLEDVNLV